MPGLRRGQIGIQARVGFGRLTRHEREQAVTLGFTTPRGHYRTLPGPPATRTGDVLGRGGTSRRAFCSRA